MITHYNTHILLQSVAGSRVVFKDIFQQEGQKNQTASGPTDRQTDRSTATRMVLFKPFVASTRWLPAEAASSDGAVEALSASEKER